ncbi:MAG: tRNA (N(6)-L-threonylcarbamoyladenosine(37)-C(2))-methylthiotransferase MtaB [Eubacteriaceae bacterium]|jgi:threonylcarbamoyladenosine tRNA methylthiotransferase MtaB
MDSKPTLERPSAAFYTLGCKVNTYDTEAIQELFEKAGYEIKDFSEPADVYVVNTCTVTHLGDRKSRQMLRRARRTNPDALIIAAGCYAQTAPEKVLEIEEVDLVIGTADRNHIVEIAEEARAGIPEGQSRNLAHSLAGTPFEELEISRTEGHTRAFVKIQEGCTQFCSYCIVPYARGPVRSRQPEKALEEIDRLSRAGYKEIVLTGIHIASYGRDFKDSRNTPACNEELISLVENASKIPGIERIRFSSIEPRLMTEDFLKRLSAINEICPHFHLSLQSGSAGVLKRMNRHYTPDEFYEIAQRIRRYYPGAALTTDIIAGFPGESEEEFQETLDFVRKTGFAQMHIFRYSPREGTPAAAMDNQVSDQKKIERAEKLAEAEYEMRHNFLRKADGQKARILVEQREEDGSYSGYTENYRPVRFIPRPGTHQYTGMIIETDLSYTGDDRLTAQHA